MLRQVRDEIRDLDRYARNNRVCRGPGERHGHQEGLQHLGRGEFQQLTSLEEGHGSSTQTQPPLASNTWEKRESFSSFAVANFPIHVQISPARMMAVLETP
jgi:hypothetical protein